MNGETRKERRREAARRYYHDHAESQREKKRQYRKNNPERVAQSHAAWRRANPEYIQRPEYKKRVHHAYKRRLKKWKTDALLVFGGYCYECLDEFLSCEMFSRTIQFDHIRGPKHYNPMHASSENAFFAEVMSKCEPVHKDCHDARSAYRKKNKLILTTDGWCLPA